MPTDKPRIIITVDEDLLAEIDDYWFANRFRSRAQAVVDLVKQALENQK